MKPQKESPPRIGVIGYSGKKFDTKTAKEFIEGIFDLLPKNTVIVSGLTNIGIPKIAYECAVEHKFKTVGYACKQAKDFPCFPVDEEHIIGDNWGDESEEFLNSIDLLIKVGGGKQSEAEFRKFVDRHGENKTIEYNLPEIK